MARISRKELKKDEIVDAAFDVGHWIETHWRTLVKIAVPIVAGALIVVAWIWNDRRVEHQAREFLARGIQQFSAARAGGFSDPAGLGQALQAFERAGSHGGHSPTIQVARYYRGVTLHKLGRLEEAIGSLEAVELAEGTEATLGAAKLLLADLLVEAGQGDRAVELLIELSSRSAAEYPVELALLQLGRIYFERGDVEQARKTWTRVVDEYPQTPAAAEASQRLGS